MSSIFVANNMILLAELIGQGLVGCAIGQADSEVLERPLLDHRANYFKRSIALICCVHFEYITLHSLHSNKNFSPTFERIFEFRIISDSDMRYEYPRWG